MPGASVWPEHGATVAPGNLAGDIVPELFDTEVVVPLLANIPPPPFSGLPGPLDIRMYGILIAIGAYLGLRLLVRRYTELGGDPDLAERTALLAVGMAIVGSRIGYVIPRWRDFLADPIAIPQIWQGGLAFFGGVALAVPVAWWYAHRRGGDVAAMIDAAAPALPLGHAIGRWGNYFNQELFGRPTDLPWALRVDPVSPRISAQFPGASTFHPTFLYESLWNLTLVGVLLWVDRRRVDGRRWLRRGSLGFLYLVGYGLGRFWTELLRVDTAERYLGLSRNNWIALLVIIIGVVGVLWWERRGTRPEAGAAEGEVGTAAEREQDLDTAAERGPDARTVAGREPEGGGPEVHGPAAAGDDGTSTHEPDTGPDEGTSGGRQTPRSGCD